MNQKNRTKHRNHRSRVRQAQLPTEDIRRPRNGDWSRMEARARAALTAANRKHGLA